MIIGLIHSTYPKIKFQKEEFLMRKVLSIFLVALMLLSFSVAYADQQQTGPAPAPPDYRNITNPSEVIDSQPKDIDLGGPTPWGEPETSTSVKSHSGILVLVNGVEVTFPDTQPYIKNNRTLVPVRFVVEQLGAQVGWNNKNQEVTIEKDGKKIILKIGSKVVTVNGSKVTLDAPAELKGDRTMVPLRFVSEAFGANVDWNGKEKVVTIEAKK
jgi:hypothetical protein